MSACRAFEAQRVSAEGCRAIGRCWAPGDEAAGPGALLLTMGTRAHIHTHTDAFVLARALLTPTPQ